MNPEELSKICVGLHLADQDGLLVKMDKRKVKKGMAKLDLVLMGQFLAIGW